MSSLQNGSRVYCNPVSLTHLDGLHLGLVSGLGLAELGLCLRVVEVRLRLLDDRAAQVSVLQPQRLYLCVRNLVYRQTLVTGMTYQG